MALRLVTLQLRKVASRLVALRAELDVIGEQAYYLDDGDDSAGHVEAMQRHRDHVVAEIRRLEHKQDRLLDRL